MSLAEDFGGRPIRETVSDAEWRARVNLAATYRLVAHYGWDDLIYTHISLRVPGEDDHFLINPYGMTFDEITASSLVKIDLDGRIVMPSSYKFNPPAFTIHSAMHMTGPDARCVIHTHSDDGVAVSAQSCGLLPLTQKAMVVLPDLAYHDYAGVALDLDERETLIRDIGDKHCLILRNHGLLTIGTTCADAFHRLYFLERACTFQIRALAGGVKPVIPAPHLLATAAAQGKLHTSVGIGNLDWPALLRTLDRKDRSFRD